MSKLNDNAILALQKEIENKKERVSKLKSKFAPETTCVFITTNLHTQKIEGLLNILSTLISEKESWDKACELSKIKIEFKHQGFTFDQWKQDILFLIDKINLKQIEQELSEDIEFLDSLVSKSTKDKIKFDQLLEKYKNK